MLADACPVVMARNSLSAPAGSFPTYEFEAFVLGWHGITVRCVFVSGLRFRAARCVVGAGCLLMLLSAAQATADQPAIDFRNDIEPILSRHGCNAGGCHGKASGQNGFKLWLFGFDAL